jgi:ribosomal protein S18 acetylase RimI-like enzyme
MEMETTFEEDLAAIKQRAAQKRALASMPAEQDPRAMAAHAQAGAGQGTREAGGSSTGASQMAGAGRAGAATVGWVKNLPKNLAKGTLDAAVNTLRTASDLADTFADLHTVPDDSELPDPANPGLTMEQGQQARLRDEADDAHLDADVAYDKWRMSLNENDDLSDSITQGIAQFSVPFTAWTKAMGGLQGLKTMQKVLKLGVAEGTTAATAWAPHDGRLADLVDMGRQSETKFGEALNAVTPDGSLMNAYIDYMTERDGESAMEGRFKNAVDSLAGSAVVAGFIKTAGLTFRAARNLPDALKQNPVRPGSLKSQKGNLNLSLMDDEPRHVPLGNVTDSHTGSVLDDEFVVPGSQVITVKNGDKPAGFIAFKEADDGSLQINRAKVAAESQGQGLGKKLLLEALTYAEKVGRQLTSDTSVTVAQLRVYEALQRKGKIKVTYSDPAAVEAALKTADARVPVRGKGGKPVVTSIERIKE